MVTRVRIYGDSMAEGRGRGNPYTVDPKGAIVYTIGYGLGLSDSKIVNNGAFGSGISDALARQQLTPAGGPGSLDILWTGHNTIRPVPTPDLVQSVKDGYQEFYTYARSNGGDCLLLGLTSGFGIEKTSDLYAALQDINTYITDTFVARDRFISYEYLCRQIGPNASATVQAMIDAGLTPTAIDRSDIISGWTPDTIRADKGVGHLNQLGQDTYGARLARHINSAPSPTPPPPSPPPVEQQITHNYASSGDYTVRLTVTDNDGRTNTTSRIVTVVKPVDPVDPEPPGTLYLADNFNVTSSRDLAPAAGLTTAPLFRFLGPNNTYGWRNVHRPQNQGDAGIVVGGTRGGRALPKRVENRSASGASFIGVDMGKIPTRWEIDFAFDPGVTGGTWKMGFHFWDAYSDVGETVPGHFSCRFRGWEFKAGNVSGSGPLLTPFGTNRDGLGDSTGSSGNWPNGDLDLYDGTSRTIYTLTIEHVGGNTLRFTFPPQTGQSPITLTDNRLEEIPAKGVCVCVWESFRALSTDSRDFITGMRFQIGTVGEAGRPAKPANDVYKAWGVNTHFSYLGADQEWKETAAAVSWLQTLGVGAVRQLLSRNTAGRNAIKTAANSLGAGVKWLLPTLTVEEITSLAQARQVMNDQLDWLVANFPLDRIRGFPGVNEPNGGDAENAPVDWVNKTKWAQQAIYEEVRKRPAFNHVQIQGPPLNMKGGQGAVPGEAAQLGDLSPWLDYGDAHVYPADDDPELGLDVKLSWVEPVHPGKPVAVTEGGYSTSTDRGYTGGSKLTAETEAGLYAPKHLMVHAVAGRQFYTYELLDGPPPYTDTQRDTREAGFGLVRVPSLTTGTWTAKPGFDAMRRLLALFKDPTPHTPSGLVVDVTGPSDLRQGLYQRSDGKWLLAVWRAVDLYTWNSVTQTGTSLAVTNRTVTVTFGQSRPVKVYEPSLQDAATRNITVTTFTINLGKGLQVCEIT